MQIDVDVNKPTVWMLTNQLFGKSQKKTGWPHVGEVFEPSLGFSTDHLIWREGVAPRQKKETAAVTLAVFQPVN